MTALYTPPVAGWHEIIPKTLITGSPTALNIDVSSYVLKEYEFTAMLRYNSGVSDASGLSLIPHNAVNGNLFWLQTLNGGTGTPAKTESANSGGATMGQFGQIGTDATAGLYTYYNFHFYDCQSLVDKPFKFAVINALNVLGTILSCWGEGTDKQTVAYDGFRLAFAAKTLDPTSWYKIMGIS